VPKMFTARTKIIKDNGQEPTDLEDDVAKALFELQEQAEAEMKVYLRDLAFSSAREVDVNANKKAVIIVVPYRLLAKYHKRLLTNACLQTRLVRELEKKFSGKIVVIIGQRRILNKPKKNERLSKQKRPRSRTLTAVHDAILEDLVYPTQIVGKRLRVAVDGQKTLKVLLDPGKATELEYKLDAYSTVYRKLTNQEAIFEFPVVAQE
jgi:small subunit ribosomal protein S7e